jgi:putative oxidoreductase
MRGKDDGGCNYSRIGSLQSSGTKPYTQELRTVSTKSVIEIDSRDTLTRQAIQLHRAVSKKLARMQSPFLLAIRLYWGWQFAQTGWGKLHHLAKISGFFASLGIPFPAFNAHFIAGLEFFGGLLLIVGLASRLTGLLLAGNMLVAYWTADHEALISIFSDPGKFYVADPYTFLFASLMVLIFGAGIFSVDALIARLWKNQR